jgi:hypothetical protein
LAETLLRLGQHGEAAKAAEELFPLFPEGGAEYHRAAGFLARCVPLAAKDESLSEAARRKLAGSYADRAVDLLRKAMHQGYKDAEELKKNPSFDPLRSRDDFRKLLSDLEEAIQVGAK